MKVLFTSAIINSYYEQRKKEYIDSFNILTNFFDKKNIHIVECFSHERIDFLENLNDNVFYTKTNSEFRNKGVKEANGLISFIMNSTNQIKEEELIIKQTGRYKFINNNFINTIKNTSYDSYVKIDQTKIQCFTGLFAIKFKYLKEFLFNLNLQKMEDCMINIERELFIYLNTKNIKTCTLSEIGLYSNINNDSIVIW